MNQSKIQRLMNLLITISAAIILIGAIFRIQHYPHATTLLTVGFLSNFILSGIEIKRLRKIITKLETK